MGALARIQQETKRIKEDRAAERAEILSASLQGEAAHRDWLATYETCNQFAARRTMYEETLRTKNQNDNYHPTLTT